MKRLHFAFGITALAIIVAGLIHGGIACIVAEVTWEPWATSFPVWAAFVLPLLYYSVVSLVILLAWLITWLIVRSVQKRLQKDSKSDTIQL